MQVIKARPPLFDEIDAKFHIAGKPVIFAWGNTIYNPEGAEISDELFAHEAVHGLRQDAFGRIEHWWANYLADPQFRLEEEVEGHKAEYLSFCSRHKDRNARARYLNTIAARLASPMYGGIITAADARRLIIN
jgi:hypothetical protein